MTSDPLSDAKEQSGSARNRVHPLEAADGVGPGGALGRRPL
ncbi:MULTISPECIES: hypothetical protein [unclassified Streptomyces]|nr:MULTISPECIES: hypothetical protein [unclassified Streptomyces]